jgi:hypothetical protein
VNALKKTSLAAAPLDLVEYDADQIKSMGTGKGIVKSTRSPELTSTEPLQKGLVERQPGMSEIIQRTFDSEGRIKRAVLADTRDFVYDANGHLKEINSDSMGRIFESPDSEGTWLRERESSPVKQIWEGKTIADPDGSIRILTPKNDVEVFGIDGTITRYGANDRPRLLVADPRYEHGRLWDKMQARFPEPQRLERFETLLVAFEKESGQRNLDSIDKALFYRQLSNLLSDDAPSKLSIAERRELAEQVLNHAAYPTTIDQGSNGTCNVTTIENRLYTRTPDHMAGMIDEVTATGAYTTANGNKVEMAQSLSGLKPDTQARASLEVQETGTGDVKIDGKRDWSSQIAQTVLAKIKHLETTEFVSRDGVIVDGDDLVYNSQNNLVGKTPDSNITRLLDGTGKRVMKLHGDDPVFVKKDGLLTQVAPKDIVFSNDGDLRGTIGDAGKITRLYDYFGNPEPKPVAGSNYYDRNGNLVMYQTVPGQITYDKILPETDATTGKVSGKEMERLHIKHLGERYFLKEVENGKETTITSPSMNGSAYLGIGNRF